MSRDLTKTSRRIQRNLERIVDVTQREVMSYYAAGLNDVRATLSRLYESYNVTGEMTRAQLTQFIRLSNVESEIRRIMNPYISQTVTQLQESMVVSLDQSFYRHAWAVDQAAGTRLNWGMLEDRQVRAAVGLVNDSKALAGFMTAAEVERHAKLINDALINYQGDARKWLTRELTQGIIQGKSVSQVARQIKDVSIGKSIRSAMTIARTETLRAIGIGSRMAYESAEDLGVKIKYIWDATLDDRVRPDHAALDGQEREGDYFQVPGIGPVRGPRESGVAEFDINCRCDVRAEVEGYAPSLRRVRDEGIVPYESAKSWIERHGVTANRYGQKYKFLD